jgi:hypothetical protein
MAQYSGSLSTFAVLLMFFAILSAEYECFYAIFYVE